MGGGGPNPRRGVQIHCDTGTKSTTSEEQEQKGKRICFQIYLFEYSKSSKMHCYIKFRKHMLKSFVTIRKGLIKLKSRSRRYCSLLSCNKVMCLFKSQTHVANYCKSQLNTDIEKKPGPRSVYVDPSKTVAAL